MTAAQILNSNETKTRKMQMLFELGFTRRQVADFLGVGYGFAQNVFASTYPDRIRRRNPLGGSSVFNFTFNRDFGIEIEAFGVNPATLERKLNEAGIETRYEGYNHTTRTYWKIVTDSSLNGHDTFELVSPILNGENGLEQLEKVCRVLKANNVKNQQKLRTSRASECKRIQDSRLEKDLQKLHQDRRDD
jgi:hypothetical protein